MGLFEIDNLTFAYNGAEQNAVSGVSLCVNKGDFVLVCGKSGCGKTTLLRLLKPALAPVGKRTGSVTFCGTDITKLDERTAASAIGFVMQNPDDQIVTDKVWHELAFGLESLGESSDVIRRRVAEICGFLGLTDIYGKRTCELSGGEKQLLNLASVLVTNPDVVLLDEPTAQLDPIAASSFLQALKKLNEELGLTVVLVEHRLEESFAMANKVVIMDEGKVVFASSPEDIGELYNNDKLVCDIFEGLPAAVRLFKATNGVGKCPLTVRDGKRYVEANFGKNMNDRYAVQGCKGDVAIEVANGYFRYERDGTDVLDNLSLQVYANEILCIFGANGAGKTTLLRILAGTKRLYKGKYRLWGKKIKEYGNNLYRDNLTAMPQNPQNLFVKNTVRADLAELAALVGYGKTEQAQAVADVMAQTGVTDLAERHPYDLSGGEKQKVALAKVLLTRPKIVLLDEPTKGLDAYSKRQFAEVMAKLKADGKTVVVVTHDVEFAAVIADRCAMFFDGKIVSVVDKYAFFAENRYYTTAFARITRENFADAVTFERAVELCNANKLQTTDK